MTFYIFYYYSRANDHSYHKKKRTYVPQTDCDLLTLYIRSVRYSSEHIAGVIASETRRSGSGLNLSFRVRETERQLYMSTLFLSHKTRAKTKPNGFRFCKRTDLLMLVAILAPASTILSSSLCLTALYTVRVRPKVFYTPRLQ